MGKIKYLIERMKSLTRQGEKIDIQRSKAKSPGVIHSLEIIQKSNLKKFLQYGTQLKQELLPHNGGLEFEYQLEGITYNGRLFDVDEKDLDFIIKIWNKSLNSKGNITLIRVTPIQEGLVIS